MTQIGKLQPTNITEEMKKSYLNYAMSVIVSRALPDVSDGLKPAHRRILFGMHEMNLTHASKWFDSGIHPTIKVTTKQGYSLQGSYNHPLLLWTKDESGKPIYMWKMLNEIEAGDIAVIERSNDLLWPQLESDLLSFHPVITN